VAWQNLSRAVYWPITKGCRSGRCGQGADVGSIHGRRLCPRRASGYRCGGRSM